MQWGCQDSSGSGVRNKLSSAPPRELPRGYQALQFLLSSQQEKHGDLQNHLGRACGREPKAKGPQMRCRLQMPCCPGVRLAGARYFTGLDISSSPRFVMLLKGSLCCNITSLYREIVLSNGFCGFFLRYIYHIFYWNRIKVELETKITLITNFMIQYVVNPSA